MDPIRDILSQQQSELLDAWLAEQQNAPWRKRFKIPEMELRQQSVEFLKLLNQVLESKPSEAVDAQTSPEIQGFLSNISRSRGLQGFSPSETATFVLSLKRPLFTMLRKACGKDADALTDAIWRATTWLDSLGLYTTEMHLKAREEVIVRQQQEMLELSTPVVKLWDGILALPLIGTLDSARTQVVMESLLNTIVDTGSEMAIIDITGVPMVDTLVAQHLLKTITAARLMGADCIISGIRPQIAQTIVHLGVDLANVVTKATLADAFSLALARMRSRVRVPLESLLESPGKNKSSNP